MRSDDVNTGFDKSKPMVGDDHESQNHGEQCNDWTHALGNHVSTNNIMFMILFFNADGENLTSMKRRLDI